MTTLTLASASTSRAAILRGAGVPFTVQVSGVDEAALKASLQGESPRAVAEALADAKAAAVSRNRSGLVIGSDQTLDLDGELIDKVATRVEARERLARLRGRTHRLHAAVAVAGEGRVLWRDLESPKLTMRSFSDRFLDDYLERQGEAILASVGCYQLEGEGAQLFERVEGDYFSILGLPLWGLMEFLRDQDVLAR